MEQVDFASFGQATALITAKSYADLGVVHCFTAAVGGSVAMRADIFDLFASAVIEIFDFRFLP